MMVFPRHVFFDIKMAHLGSGNDCNPWYLEVFHCKPEMVLGSSSTAMVS